MTIIIKKYTTEFLSEEFINHLIILEIFNKYNNNKVDLFNINKNYFHNFYILSLIDRNY